MSSCPQKSRLNRNSLREIAEITSALLTFQNFLSAAGIDFQDRKAHQVSPSSVCVCVCVDVWVCQALFLCLSKRDSSFFLVFLSGLLICVYISACLRLGSWYSRKEFSCCYEQNRSIRPHTLSATSFLPAMSKFFFINHFLLPTNLLFATNSLL